MATIQIINLLEDGCAVVVVDSAGAERTARVCERIQIREKWAVHN
jgi:hypothetical protein